MNHAAINILAQILVDNSGQRLTHALSTGIVSTFSQALASIPQDPAEHAAQKDDTGDAA